MKKLKNLSVNLTKKWLPLALAIDERVCKRRARITSIRILNRKENSDDFMKYH